MARYPNATEIYEIAAIFAEECLIGDGSLLYPDRKVWRSENLELLWRALVMNPDTGGENYLTKLTGQLSGQPEDVIRMMAEATAIYCLFPITSSIGSARKRSLIEEVLALSPDIDQPDALRWDSLMSAFDGEGIGSTGTGYNTARDNQISFILAFAKAVKQNSITSFAEIDPKRTANRALEMVREIRNHRPFATYNILLHLLWPDDYEGTASTAQKDRMAKNLSMRLDLNIHDDVDETINNARQHMEANGVPERFQHV